MVQEENSEYHKITLDTLKQMKLPKVPKKLSDLLFVNFQGKGGIPAVSAIGAHQDKQGNPLVIISLIYKSKLIEEVYPFKDLKWEFPIFVEVAEELLTAQEEQTF